MKKLKVLLSVLVVVCFLSSCSIFKGKKCDCPKFNYNDDAPTQQEWVLDDKCA